jgi:poly(hydroxyalkanoate) depolymerase family esterase
MKRRLRRSGWAKSFERQFVAMTRIATSVGTRALAKTFPSAAAQRKPPGGAGLWTPGVALGAHGARHFRLYRPPGVDWGERLPLMVMLHGCGQDANSFARSTRMNLIAQRERFLVLYPEQDRMANSQGCWNWFDTDNGRAFSEAALIMKAIDQVCLLQPVDRTRVAVAGLSAGASMAAVLVSRHPERFKALVMHSGVAPGSAHSSLSALSAMRGQRQAAPLAARPVARRGAAPADWPALLVVHGQADGVVSPRNGVAAAHAWAQAAGACAAEERRVQRGKRYPSTVTEFRHEGNTVATLVAVEGLAHAWSGGAASQPYSDAQGPDASRMAWAFALRQFDVVPRRRAALAAASG